MKPDQVKHLLYDWKFWARPNQLEPTGEWNTWALIAGRGYGKDLSLDTLVPTVTGWTTMGEILPGERVFDETGNPCNVTNVYDIRVPEECYEIRFSDGTLVRASSTHEWLTEDKVCRKAKCRGLVGSQKVRTTSEIFDTLIHKSGERNHSVITTAPIELPDSDLSLDPYILGYWLGNGSTKEGAITCRDYEILEIFKKLGFEIQSIRKPNETAPTYLIRGLNQALRTLGVFGNKHIPIKYLRSSYSQRLSLLQGLMDSDGCCNKGGSSEITFTRKKLFDDVVELISTFGIKQGLEEGIAKIGAREIGPKWRSKFTTKLPVYRLERKLSRLNHNVKQQCRLHRRFIEDVRKIESVPMRCISVDSPNKLYLITKSLIPTHNSRVGAEWIRSRIEKHGDRIVHLVGKNAAAVRDTMLEGESGIISISPPWNKPKYVPSKRVLLWPNGAKGLLFSSEEPDNLRGPQCHAAWADEVSSWEYPETWDQLKMGLRLGENPRVVVTTTPKPIELIRRILKDPGTVVTRGSTYENSANLARSFIAEVERIYAGTRFGDQELNGEVLEDLTGGLWTPQCIDRNRVGSVDVPLRRTIIAVDPAVSVSDASDETGIVVAALGQDGRGYILADLSGKYHPEAWAQLVVDAYRQYECDLIVAEENNGGKLVEANVRTIAQWVNYEGVRASDSKIARAEPVAALYEQNKVAHVGKFVRLESQMTNWNPNETKKKSRFSIDDGNPKSPDRVDALVWALSKLMIGIYNVPGSYDSSDWDD